MNNNPVSSSKPPDLGNMTPQDAAEWRTRNYGNDAFASRQRPGVPVGVAVGDSWFDYLPARLTGSGDIIDCLNASNNFNIQRTAVEEKTRFAL